MPSKKLYSISSIIGDVYKIKFPGVGLANKIAETLNDYSCKIEPHLRDELTRKISYLIVIPSKKINNVKKAINFEVNSYLKQEDLKENIKEYFAKLPEPIVEYKFIGCKYELTIPCSIADDLKALLKNKYNCKFVKTDYTEHYRKVIVHLTIPKGKIVVVKKVIKRFVKNHREEIKT